MRWRLESLECRVRVSKLMAYRISRSVEAAVSPARRRPRAERRRLRQPCYRGELPQHVMQNPAMPVVLELLRRVDAQPRFESLRLAAVAVRDDRDRLGGSAIETDHIEGLLAGKPQARRILAVLNCSGSTPIR